MKALRTYSMVGALLAIVSIFQYLTSGAYLEPRNVSNLLRQMSVTGILSVGMVIIIVSGQIDLSVGSVVCFLGALITVLNTNLGFDPSLAFLIALGVGVFIGAIQGYLVSYQSVPAFIVTLGGMLVFRGASMWITGNSTISIQNNWLLLVGTSYLGKVPGWIFCVVVLSIILMTQTRNHFKQKGQFESLPTLAFCFQMMGLIAFVVGLMTVLSRYEGIPFPVLILFISMGMMHFISRNTVWGRHIYAVGGNREAAFLSGINDRLRITTVFILMGFFASIGGLILTARVGSASPDAGQLLELDAIASCVIGGTSLSGGIGTIPGAILGALVMESLNNGMSMANIEPFWQYIVKGLVLVIAVWADSASRKKAYC